MRKASTLAAAASVLGLLMAFAAPLVASAATVGEGDLIKLPDDGNPNTDADTAVYFVGGDGKRYVFPNAQTYFTWYKDFSTVKTVTAGELAALPIGGNVTYRPGTRLVKITSDPNVYAVEPGGSLRWVQNESIAKTLYGDAWNRRVDDVPDAYFFNYSIGAPLAAAVYPEGSIVKRANDGAVFRIENRNKRKIVSADVLAALRVQDQFVLTATGDLAEYPDGPDIVAAEPTIGDTSQKTVSNLPSVPTFSVRNPATNYIAIGGEATFLEVHLATLKAVSLQKLTFRIDATTDGDPGQDLSQRAVDDDKGGLVYQNNAQRNLTGVRVVDASGKEIFGRRDPALDVSQDQSQTFTFTGSQPMPAGQETVLYLRADTNASLPAGEGYKATLVVAGIALADAATGGAAAFQPQADLVGPTLSTLSASLEVSSSSTPGNQTYVRGAKAAMLSGLSFKATAVAPNVVKSVTLQCYVNDTGGGALVPANGANGTPCNAIAPQVSLYDLNAVKIAGPVPVTIEGRASFTGMNYSVPAGVTGALQVGADLSPTINLSNGPDRLSFDVTNAATDVTVVDDKGSKVNAAGALPNGGSNATYVAAVKQRGRVGWSWAGGGGNGVAGREVQLGTLTADVHDDAYNLKTLTFTQANGVSKSLGSLRLEYPTGQGSATASVTKSFVGSDAVFTNLPIVLPKDAKTDIKVFAQLLSRDAGAQEGELLKVVFNKDGAFQFVSATDGTTYSGADIMDGGDFTVGANTASSVRVLFTDLLIEKLLDSPSGTVQREQSEPVLTFRIKTGAEGGARLKKLVFKLLPGDAGQAGAQNDSLEGWANVNGDFPDDDGVANLKQIVPNTSGTVLGEGSGASIKFSIVSGGTKDTAPSARQSAPGDYGLLEYTFDDGSEFSLGQGTTTNFSFEIDTTKFAQGSEWPFTVELEGADQFVWSDLTSGSYTPLRGTDASGLPTSGAVTVAKS